ncbi:glycosyltransferase family 4 protein [Hufsiella ginkgonis]|uniref:Glycosyltransferase n=1 Tax=Hufsiella ginkgonis TaxID=2695274 RepID=A0A7K1Y2B7_9SPHI|nr:glycosyltransferase family 4 protein [Hufsiella ginkgonis]MXV17424.1 hypothetical protein [Hufsiella ginkgonis]
MQEKGLRILHHSPFKAKPFGHGGERRTAQVVELLQRRGFILDSLNWEHSDSKPTIYKLLRAPLYALYFVKFCIEARIFIKPFPQEILFIGFSYRYFVTSVKPMLKNNYHAFIWESTYDRFFLLAFLLKKHKLPVFAIPHNLESLVPGRKSFLHSKTAPAWLPNEMKMLKSTALHTFAIAREEEWLLNLHGVKAHYLPYYPVTEVVNYFEEIRKKRRSTGNFLLIGTATNLPTYLGMKKLIDNLEGRLGEVVIDLAGYGTERFNAEYSGLANFNILGTLSNEVLQQKLAGCKGVVLYNQPSSGVLTKVIEFMLSGIPLVVDPGSARSYYNLDGLFIYNDVGDLTHLLKHFDTGRSTTEGKMEILKMSAFEDYFITTIVNCRPNTEISK